MPRPEGRPDGLVRIPADRVRPRRPRVPGEPARPSRDPFRIKEAAEKKVVFENPEHDFPQRVLYWMTADDALHARIEGTLRGQPESEEWSWRRTR